MEIQHANPAGIEVRVLSAPEPTGEDHAQMGGMVSTLLPNRQCVPDRGMSVETAARASNGHQASGHPRPRTVRIQEFPTKSRNPLVLCMDPHRTVRDGSVSEAAQSCRVTHIRLTRTREVLYWYSTVEVHDASHASVLLNI